MDFLAVHEIKNVYQLLGFIAAIYLGWWFKDLQSKRKNAIDIATKNLDISNATYAKASELNGQLTANLFSRLSELDTKVAALEQKVNHLEENNRLLTSENENLKRFESYCRNNHT